MIKQMLKRYKFNLNVNIIILNVIVFINFSQFIT